MTGRASPESANAGGGRVQGSVDLGGPPAILVAVLVLLMTLVYLGSVIDPVGHLHGLPVGVVNEDEGSTVGSERINLGQQVEQELSHSPAVSSRLSLRPGSLAAVEGQMDVGSSTPR